MYYVCVWMYVVEGETYNFLFWFKILHVQSLKEGSLVLIYL